MASQSKKETLPITAVITNLFRNLPRLMLTNLLFAVPMAAFLGLFWFLGTLLPLDSMQQNLLTLLTLVPLSPFYAGVVKVTVKMASGEEKTPVWSNFFSAVKENFGRFLIHGAVFYVAVVFSYISFSIYLHLISVNMLFVAPFVITIIIMLVLAFMFFYIPAMTVTFDIPMKYIYKNSFLMSYGELKNNFIGLFGLFLLTVVSTTFLIACYGSPVAVVIVTAVLAAVFVPAIAAFIIHSAVYAQMYAMITDRSRQMEKINAKIDAKKQEHAAQSRDELLESLRNFEVDESIPDDEYVYFNGRMVKNGTLKKLKKEAEESGGA